MLHSRYFRTILVTCAQPSNASEELFIDRDPTLFGILLEYLRNPPNYTFTCLDPGALKLSHYRAQRQNLIVEMQFFEIDVPCRLESCPVLPDEDDDELDHIRSQLCKLTSMVRKLLNAQECREGRDRSRSHARTRREPSSDESGRSDDERARGRWNRKKKDEDLADKCSDSETQYSRAKLKTTTVRDKIRHLRNQGM